METGRKEAKLEPGEKRTGSVGCNEEKREGGKWEKRGAKGEHDLGVKGGG